MNPGLSDVEIARRVEHAIRKQVPKRLRAKLKLRILRHGIQREDDWWYVPICPGPTVRGYIYYDMLATIEGQLQDEEKLNVLLVPVRP
jgi:hypothetical protein